MTYSEVYTLLKKFDTNGDNKLDVKEYVLSHLGCSKVSRSISTTASTHKRLCL